MMIASMIKPMVVTTQCPLIQAKIGGFNAFPLSLFFPAF